MHQLFVYGTLMIEDIFCKIITSKHDFNVAHLQGFKRLKVKNQVYPALVPGSSQDQVEGILYRDLALSELQRLDIFEGQMYTRKLIRVQCQNDQCEAWTYLCKPSFRHHVSKELWNLSDFDRAARAIFLGEFAGWCHQQR